DDVFIRQGIEVEIRGDDAANRTDKQRWFTPDAVSHHGGQRDGDHGDSHRYCVDDQHGGALNIGVLSCVAHRIDHESRLHDGEEGEEADANNVQRLLLQNFESRSLALSGLFFVIFKDTSFLKVCTHEISNSQHYCGEQEWNAPSPGQHGFFRHHHDWNHD